MTLRAWLQESAATGHRPREPRLRVSLEASGASADGAAVTVTIHNISATGILLECNGPIAVGEELAIDLPLAPDTRASVVWSSGRFHGCRFASELSRPTLSAAQLRSAVGKDVEGVPAVPEAQSGPGEPLDLRLRRLRKLRGLTLDELARALGVSKPTVWAWEQARSTPSPDRHEKIAEVLGTSLAELRTGRRDDVASAVLERSRRHIAEAFGVRAESVRIMIEL